MQVSVEEVGSLGRRMKVRVPAERVEKEVQNRLMSLSRTVRLHGFRPGKVPLKVVKRRYGDQVRQEVLSEVLRDSLQNALMEQNLRPVEGPAIEPRTLEAGKDLEYDATFEVFPEFEILGLEGIHVERPVAQVTDADVDSMLDTLRQQRTEWNEVQRPSQEGDRVTVDFHGQIDGEDFTGNKGENLPVVLGRGALLPDFEKNLTGVSADTETRFDVTFPENYHVPDLAGRTAQFTAQVKSVAEPRLPAVDDAFAQTFGIEEDGVDGLRRAIRENMERELEDAITARLKQQLMEALLEANPISVPESLVQQEIERMAQQSGLKFQADDEQAAERKKQLFEHEARRRVTLGFLVSKLITSQNLQLDQARVQQRLEKMASTYEEPRQVIDWYNQNPQALEGIKGLVLEDQVVGWLLERATVTEKPSSFQAVIKPDAGTSDETGEGDNKGGDDNA